MTCFLIVSSSFLLMGLYFFSSYIKKSYQKYDQEETLRENIEYQKYLIKGAMNYLRTQYDNDFDSTAYKNIKIKVDFLKPIIEKRPPEKKLYYYRKLYEKLYETTYRLKTDFNNVVSILKPLSSLIDEIVEEQIDYLRENSENNDL